MKPLFWFKLSILTLNLEFSTACVLTCCKSNQEALIISWVLQKVRETEPKRAKSRLCSLVHSLSELALARASCCWCLRKSAESCGQPARSCGVLRAACGKAAGACGKAAGACGKAAGTCCVLRELAEPCWSLLPACSKVLPCLGRSFFKLGESFLNPNYSSF
jgi:hypothetical protein